MVNEEITERRDTDPPEAETMVKLGELLGVLRRRRQLLASVWLIALGAAMLLYLVTPRSYKSTTTLEIEPQDVGSIAIENLLLIEGPNLEYYETQYRLLQSRGMAERVVQNLGLAEDPTFNPPRASFLRWRTDPLDGAEDEVVLGEMAERLLDDLEIAPVRRTRLVHVSYVAPTPELAANVANGVADAFIDWGVEKRYRTVGRASSFLGAQIETLKKEIGDKEAELQAYSRRTDIVALDPQANITLQSLEALNRNYTEAVSLRIDHEARYRELMRAAEEAIADTLSDGLVAALRAEQAKLEREYANRLATYKPEWPTMQELKAQIDKGRQNLVSVINETVSKARENARTEYQTALRREQSLVAELGRKKSDAMELNSAAVEYNNLKVEVSTRRSLLDELLRRQSETLVASRLEGTGESNVAVVDRALKPLEAYRPSLLLNLGIGVIVGLVLGITSVYAAEYRDRTIKTPEEAERILSIPILGAIPDVSDGSLGSGYYYASTTNQTPGKINQDRKGRNQPDEIPIELIPQTHPRHGISEAYRSLRTALLLSRAEDIKVVAVTSAGPEEGKSVTAANLGAVTAQLGRPVLLVDADLRKPRLHRIFQVPNRVGLVNYLAGGPDAESILLSTAIPNLFLSPAGPAPAGPSELLSSERMHHFIKLVRERGFELVIIDSPPVLPVTDATVLGSLSDGVILCLRSGVVLREDAVSCEERLRLANVNILGVVLNAYRPQARYGHGYQHYEEYAHPRRKKVTQSVA